MNVTTNNPTYRLGGSSLTITPLLYSGHPDVVDVRVTPGARFVFYDDSLWKSLPNRGQQAIVQLAIGYAEDGISYRSYLLDGFTTRLSTEPTYDESGHMTQLEDGLGAYNIYVRISVVSQRALLIFSMGEKPGLVFADDQLQYVYVRIGQLGAVNGSERIVDVDFGCLDTPKGNDQRSGEWYDTDSAAQTVDFKQYGDGSSWSFGTFRARVYQFLDSLGASANQAFISISKIITSASTSTDTDNESIATTAWMANHFLRKDKYDATEHDLHLGGTTTFGSTSVLELGTSGNGFTTVDGHGVLQVQRLSVLEKMEAKEVEIQEVNYIGGTQVLTAANGFTVTDVKWVGEDGLLTESETLRVAYRLYFETSDGDVRVRNTWQTDDFAFCERWDFAPGSTSDFTTHRWWRRVFGTPNQTDNFIDVIDYAGPYNMEPGSDVPAIGDKVVMLGNRRNTDRQSAIFLSATQSGAPFIRLYTGINSFNLSEANCPIDLNPADIKIYAKSILLQSGSTVEQDITNLQKNYENSQGILDDVSKQLDQSFLIHQVADDTVPSISNEPASSWTTDELRAEHVGDFYINRSGLVWKFTEYSSGGAVTGYDWEPIDDKYLISFVRGLDAKAQVFRTNENESPAPGTYKVNDLWVDVVGTFNDLDGSTHTYDHEMLVCTSTTFRDIRDWEPANSYQKNVSSYLQQMQQIAAKYDINLDGKVETFFLPYGSTLPEWSDENDQMQHLGDLAYIEPKDDKEAGQLFEYIRHRDADDKEYTYSWEESNDAITLEVIRMASQAKDTADGKRTTFIFEKGKTPSGYSVGDLWAPVTGQYRYTDEKGPQIVNYDNDLLVCIRDFNSTFSIADWSRVGVTKEILVQQGLLEKEGFAELYAQAITGGKVEAEAKIDALVRYDSDLKRYVSAIEMHADNIIMDARQTKFISSVKQELDIGVIQEALKRKIEPSTLLAALNSETVISGGTISTELIDVNNIYVKHLDGADGTFDGFIQTKFVRAEDVEEVINNTCTLKGEHCHLIVKNWCTYRLPVDGKHIGKRIVLLNIPSAGGLSTVEVVNGDQIIGYKSLSTDVVSDNVTSIRFGRGILEFLAVPGETDAVCRWVCITNKAEDSRANTDLFLAPSPRLLYYAEVQRDGRNTVTPTKVRSYLSDTPNIYPYTGYSEKDGTVRIDLSNCFPNGMSLAYCMISVTGLPGVGASAVLPTFAAIGTYNETDNWFDVQTGNRSNNLTNGGFILRIDY